MGPRSPVSAARMANGLLEQAHSPLALEVISPRHRGGSTGGSNSEGYTWFNPKTSKKSFKMHPDAQQARQCCHDLGMSGQNGHFLRSRFGRLLKNGGEPPRLIRMWVQNRVPQIEPPSFPPPPMEASGPLALLQGPARGFQGLAGRLVRLVAHKPRLKFFDPQAAGSTARAKESICSWLTAGLILCIGHPTQRRNSKAVPPLHGRSCHEHGDESNNVGTPWQSYTPRPPLVGDLSFTTQVTYPQASEYQHHPPQEGSCQFMARRSLQPAARPTSFPSKTGRGGGV